jgi:hypothetical protein
MLTTSVRCPFEMPDGELCGDEIEIEWVTHHLPPEPTGHHICTACGIYDYPRVKQPLPQCLDFEGEVNPQHYWADEYDDGNTETELVSMKSYCFHPMSKTQANELLDDLAVAYAERRVER